MAERKGRHATHEWTLAVIKHTQLFLEIYSGSDEVRIDGLITNNLQKVVAPDGLEHRHFDMECEAVWDADDERRSDIITGSWHMAAKYEGSLWRVKNNPLLLTVSRRFNRNYKKKPEFWKSFDIYFYYPLLALNPFAQVRGGPGSTIEALRWRTGHSLRNREIQPDDYKVTENNF